MAKYTDKNSYTLLFSVIMVLVVGSILAGVAQSLKERITENERFEKQQNILYAMGVHNNEGEGDVEFISTEDVEEVFGMFITKQLVIKGSDISENDEAYLINIKKEEKLAKDKSYVRQLPLFIGEKDGETFYIIPMRGKGLWDAIWGFISLDENFIVQGAFFDHKGETPGLGANIKERYFMDDFIGEDIMNEADVFKGIVVAKGNNDPKNEIKDDNEVDALAGATITGDGLSVMIKSNIKMYLPYLNSIKK